MYYHKYGFQFYKVELLTINTEKQYFENNNQKILYMFDVPHLLKAIRNNLLQHSYVDDNEALWQYINDLYNDNKNKQYRIAPKLTEAHINLNNFQRMKVKFATQVLSATVSVALNT